MPEEKGMQALAHMLEQQRRDLMRDAQRLTKMDTRITALEAMVKKLNRDLEKLKRAQ